MKIDGIKFMLSNTLMAETHLGNTNEYLFQINVSKDDKDVCIISWIDYLGNFHSTTYKRKEVLANLESYDWITVDLLKIDTK